MRRALAVLAICLAGSVSARADDWAVKRDPFDPVVVRRYKEVLTRDPHDGDALRKLVDLYRRYRTLAKLDSEYRTQLGATDDWATLVVLARMPGSSRSDAIALWQRAIKARPTDTQGWLAIGDLASDAAAARDAYQHAAKHASAPRQRKLALSKLVGVAKNLGDVATVDAAYGELIELSPKDGVLWLERGVAQLEAKQLQAAKATLATAETLLATDPERRLTAMYDQAIVLERLGQPDDAIAQYLHTLDKTPRGFYLGREIVPRIVDVERKRDNLRAAITLFEKRWPERARGYFEWDQLGDLYKEAHEDEGALSAYKHAVAKAPTEVATQRKLIKLLDQLHPDEALAQHEAAARVAPGEVDLQLELAKRYHPVTPDKAFTTLERLARRMSNNVNVRRAIAELYVQWEQPARAIVEYEAVAALEPEEADNHVVLGEAYWQAGNQDNARAAWQQLERAGTAASLLRHGEVLTVHELWQDAAAAYTKSLALDATNADAWRGRAQAYDELGKFADAVADAKSAVALIGTATRETGFRERHLLVRVLGRWYASGDTAQLEEALARWRFAFEHGDDGAGYLLVAHHSRIASHQLHALLLELYRRVPTDDSLGIELARSYRREKDFKQARKQLELIAKRSAARAEEVGKLIEQLDQERARAEQEARWEEQGVSSYRRRGKVDLVGQRLRFGMRVELGADVQTSASALLGFGFYRTRGFGHGTTIPIRLDWTRRNDEMARVDAIALSAGVAQRILATRRFEVAAGAAPRVELRYGSNERSPWNRPALAGDITLEVLPRALPATLGVRFHHTLTDATPTSALLVELGFEVR